MPPGDLAWVSGVVVGSGRLGVSIVRLSFYSSVSTLANSTQGPRLLPSMRRYRDRVELSVPCSSRPDIGESSNRYPTGAVISHQDHALLKEL